jgi:hypothetical protein
MGTQFMLVETGFQRFHCPFRFRVLIFLRFHQFLQDLGTGLVVWRNLERVALMQGNARLAGFTTMNQHELGIFGAFADVGPLGTIFVRIDARYS